MWDVQYILYNIHMVSIVQDSALAMDIAVLH